MKEVALAFLKLSLLGFGGPNAHLALMHADLVERRRWLDRDHFMHLLAVTNLLPGPHSSEVAIHIGYVRAGVWGGIVAGCCFVAPTLLLVTASAIAYFHYGATPGLGGVLDGIKPAVIALVLVAGLRLGGSAVRDPVEAALAALGAAAVVFTPRWELAAMAVGLLVAFVRARGRAAPPPSDPGRGTAPPRRAPVALPLDGRRAVGGGYLLVPLVHTPVVEQHAWLTEREFLDGMAITHGLRGRSRRSWRSSATRWPGSSARSARSTSPRSWRCSSWRPGSTAPAVPSGSPPCGAA